MKVLLGVGGGVAAYKAAELVRALQRRSVEVQVAMTQGAEEFIRPLTFASLTGKQVLTSLWQPSPTAEGAPTDFAIEHIAVVQEADAFVVAPTTANLMAKFAHGIADDFLTTAFLAAKIPVTLAPAMNVNMWDHPATQANLRALQDRGVRFVLPEAGYLACGMVGSGRLAEVEVIAERVIDSLARRSDLAGETILITAGGTREPIDPVRFLGNRSSGKMGHALAIAAADRGADVILVTASANLPNPPGMRVTRVNTAEEMRQAVLQALPEATVVIKSAAVADYRAKEIATTKLRRSGPMVMEFEPNEDIAAAVVKNKRPGTVVIAFAAETGGPMLEHARDKMQRKGVDAIVVNDVSQPGIGFDTDRNAGVLLTADATVELPESSKLEMANLILDQARQLRHLQTVAV